MSEISDDLSNVSDDDLQEMIYNIADLQRTTGFVILTRFIEMEFDSLMQKLVMEDDKEEIYRLQGAARANSAYREMPKIIQQTFQEEQIIRKQEKEEREQEYA